MNRRPELYAAIVCGVPLLDMQRYTKLGAGASWVAEYGDPETADWTYMSKLSPYQNLRVDVAYPPVFYYTSTRDDRVHPGHGSTANQDQLAYRIAFEYAYFARMLMEDGG
jgi:prolyl oligopeptidase